MLPVLRRVGSPAPWRDPFDTDDFFGLSREMDRLARSMLEPFGLGHAAWWTRPLAGSVPVFGAFPAEVTETDDAFRLVLEAPGFGEDDLEVRVEGRSLRVSGRRSREREEDGARYWIRERSFGRFERIFTLPDTVDPDRVEATYHDGVLEIHMPKRESARPRRLKISRPRVLDRLIGGRKRKEAGERHQA